MNAFVDLSSGVAIPQPNDDIKTDSHSTNNEYDYAFSEEQSITKAHITESTAVTIRQRELESGIVETVMCTVQEICTQMAQLFTNGNSVIFVQSKRTTTVTCSVSTSEGTSSVTMQQTEESSMTQSTMVNQAQEAMKLILQGTNPKNMKIIQR